MRIIKFTWEEFDEAVEKISNSLSKVSWGSPICIYGVPRGGLVLAVALSHKLNIPIVFSIRQPCLIVDEICDSGKTLSKLILNIPFLDDRTVTATIHFGNRSKFVPDIWLYEKPDNSWIVYPWEKEKVN